MYVLIIQYIFLTEIRLGLSTLISIKMNRRGSVMCVYNSLTRIHRSENIHINNLVQAKNIMYIRGTILQPTFAQQRY